jgi:DNA-binding MarR family transcriptional regulator
LLFRVYHDYTPRVTKPLQDEIKQRKPFPSLETEVYVNLQRTADRLLADLEKLLKTEGLSQPQYNVLRILRGSLPEGLACRDIAERMITRDPDITRLLDRMEKRKIVSRSRDRRDRRVVKAQITARGLTLLRNLDGPLKGLHSKQLGHIPARKLRYLSGLLDEVRDGHK